MKKTWIKLLALCAVVLVVGAPLVFAAMSPESGVTTGSSFKFAQSVSLPKDTDHRGDMFIAASNVKLTGKVRGNVFVACSDLTVSDFEIDGSLFVACGNADIEAKIDGQVYVVCASLNDKSEVFGDYKVGSGSCVLSGKYHGEVDMAGGDEPGAVFEGYAEQLNITGGKVIIGKQADIKGKINIAVAKDTVPVYPERLKDQVKIEFFDNPSQSVVNILSLKDMIIGLIVGFLIGFFLFYFGRHKSEKIVSYIQNNFFISLLWGLVALIAVPIAFIIVLLLLAPASIVPMFAVFFVFLFALYAGIVYFAYWIGELIFRLFKKTANVYATLAVGCLVTFGLLYIMAVIPGLIFVGGIIKFVMALAGFGAILLGLFRKEHQAV